MNPAPLAVAGGPVGRAAEPRALGSLQSDHDSVGIDDRVVSADPAPMAFALDTLAYARKLREAGFSEQQAEGQAEALAAAMTDTLATKQDVRELEARMDGRFGQVDARLDQMDRSHEMRTVELEKRIELRISEQTAILRGEMADLERRMTLRLGGITVAGFGVLSALIKLT